MGNELGWDSEYDALSAPEFSRSRPVASTRKPHECCACGGVIPTGNPAIYFVYKLDDELHTEYSCVLNASFGCPLRSDMWAYNLLTKDSPS